MRHEFRLDNVELATLLRNIHAKGFQPCCILNSNTEGAPTYVAIGASKQFLAGDELAFDALDEFVRVKADWLFGYLSYDLKNEVENLDSHNPDHHEIPALHFFVPECVVEIVNNQACLWVASQLDTEPFLDLFEGRIGSPEAISQPIVLKPRISKAEYLGKIDALQDHIQQGDIYEVNFCQEFYARGAIDPVRTYLDLNERTKAPFSAYYNLHHHYLICGSPERFLKREGNRVISQPIKGTTSRSTDPVEDGNLARALAGSEKERAENVMIVDLVRNDLSRTAVKGSVKVDELFGVYSFETVHQLVSTISSQIREGLSSIDVIRNAFPMGSMTGAPKVRAMQLIEQYEDFKRGWYSGAVGYFKPNGDFDFNVVIRSILYNAETGYISCPVGGAITAKSDPEQEYEECLLKAGAMIRTLQQQ